MYTGSRFASADMWRSFKIITLFHSTFHNQHTVAWCVVVRICLFFFGSKKRVFHRYGCSVFFFFWYLAIYFIMALRSKFYVSGASNFTSSRWYTRIRPRIYWARCVRVCVWVHKMFICLITFFLYVDAFLFYLLYFSRRWREKNYILSTFNRFYRLEHGT